MTETAAPQFSPESYTSPLTWEQNAQLLLPVSPNRVGRTQGNSNMEAYDIRAHLNRIFGFACWDGEAEVMEQVGGDIFGRDKDNTKDVVTVVYRCRYTLRVKAPEGRVLATYTEWATGDAANFPTFKYGDAHDFAMKTAESQALKRCAINLGDQFGLSLYRKGSLDAVVGWSLVKSPDADERLFLQGHPERSVPDVVPEQDPDVADAGEENQDAWTDQGSAKDQARGRQTTLEGDVVKTLKEWQQDFEAAFQRGPDAMYSFRKLATDAKAPDKVLKAVNKVLADYEASLQAQDAGGPQGDAAQDAQHMNERDGSH